LSSGLPRLTVYGRGYCHLCDEMVAALRSFPAGRAFEVEVVDVDASPELEARYGDRVPVLAADGRELCHFRLDPDALTAYLRGLS